VPSITWGVGRCGACVPGRIPLWSVVGLLGALALLPSGCAAAGESHGPRSPALAAEGSAAPTLVPALPEPARTEGALVAALSTPEPVAPAREAVAPSTVVILVVLDGIRWQDIFQGPDLSIARRQWMLGKLPKPAQMMPVIYRRLFSEGVAIGGKGAAFSASGPVFVSLPGYMEIMTGHPQKGCTTNGCDPIAEPTIADEVRASPGTLPEEVAVISSWEQIDRAAAQDTSRIVVSAGRHGGKNRAMIRDKLSEAARRTYDEGEASVPYPGGYDYRPDRFTAPVALSYLAQARPRFLFIGLGDGDEYGHGNDYARYLDSLRFADAFFGDLFKQLDEMGDYGKGATVLVTADHGRAKDFKNHGKAPESARSWLLAAGSGIAARGSIALPEAHSLSDITPTIRVLLSLPAPDTTREGAGAPLGAILQAPLDHGPTASLW
jgi:hypothetical protein